MAHLVPVSSLQCLVLACFPVSTLCGGDGRRGGGEGWGRKRLLDVETKKDQGETRRKSLIHCSCSVTLRVEMTGGK